VGVEQEKEKCELKVWRSVEGRKAEGVEGTKNYFFLLVINCESLKRKAYCFPVGPNILIDPFECYQAGVCAWGLEIFNVCFVELFRVLCVEGIFFNFNYRPRAVQSAL
jgi:hypothetical protein